MKDKKKDTKKKNTKENEFFKKVITSRGLYIALCSMVAVVGFTVYSRQLRDRTEERIASFDSGAWQEAALESEVSVIDIEEKTSPKPLKEEKTVEERIVNSFEKVPEVIETVADAQPTAGDGKILMDMPHNGVIIMECSLDELLYSETMKDWRTHNGIDIEAKVGDQVKAAADGVVSKVYKDDLSGVVVEVDHGGGVVSLYKGLQSEDFIKVGTKLKKGDIVGGVGESGALEKNLGPHLHFEIKVNDDYKNPMEFLKN